MPASKKSLPVIESGDRLTRAEFHRRYDAREDIKKAELVEGVVDVGSPVDMSDSASRGGVAHRKQH